LLPRLKAREPAALAAASALIAIVMSWPLALHLGADLPQDLGDPLLQTWQVAWNGHALLHQPTHFFDANIFWPEKTTLAFSDALVGYAPAGLIGAGVHAAVVRYNLLYLFAYALAFAGAYLLARELGARPLAAAAAGAAFAYAPWRLAHNGHLHVISSGGVPLALFLLLRGVRRHRPWTVFTGWLVATWQLSLGFTLGLQLAYLLGILGIVWFVNVRAGRASRPPREVIAATIAGALIFGAWGFVQSRPYQKVAAAHPEAVRSEAEVRLFSPPPAGFLSAPANDYLWGNATAAARRRLSWPPEQTVFLGAFVLIAAAIGLAGRAPGSSSMLGSNRLRWSLAAGTAITVLLATGYALANGYLGYRLLYDFAPGFHAIRTPGRLLLLASLGLGLLAAAGIERIRAPRGGKSFLWRHAAALVITAGIFLDGFGPVPHPAFPAEPKGQAHIASPQLHLPLGGLTDARYVFWSVDGFPKIVNGYSGFIPTNYDRLSRLVTSFPDAGSIEALRKIGVKTVVLHRDLIAGTAWRNALSRPVDGLGISAETHGDLIVYHL
jgi:hypothetical protein